MSEPTIDEIMAMIAKHGSVTAEPLRDLIVTVVLEAVEAEREACAKVVENYAGAWDDQGFALSQAIRARGQE
jgi:hypothetical protein